MATFTRPHPTTWHDLLNPLARAICFLKSLDGDLRFCGFCKARRSDFDQREEWGIKAPRLTSFSISSSPQRRWWSCWRIRTPERAAKSENRPRAINTQSVCLCACVCRERQRCRERWRWQEGEVDSRKSNIKHHCADNALLFYLSLHFSTHSWGPLPASCSNFPFHLKQCRMSSYLPALVHSKGLGMKMAFSFSPASCWNFYSTLNGVTLKWCSAWGATI